MSVNRIIKWCPPMTASMSFEERAILATEVFNAVFYAHQSFREDNVGADLAYLMGAILSPPEQGDFVDWSSEALGSEMTPLILDTLQTCFHSSHAVWRFIRLEQEHNDDP